MNQPEQVSRRVYDDIYHPMNNFLQIEKIYNIRAFSRVESTYADLESEQERRSAELGSSNKMVGTGSS